jgi:hypothetical protein
MESIVITYDLTNDTGMTAKCHRQTLHNQQACLKELLIPHPVKRHANCELGLFRTL